jgi:hypothetical protein
MSRTNHHRRYNRWNITRRKTHYPRTWNRYPGVIVEYDEPVGMEVYDLRFYAGCRRRPQLIHRVLDTYGLYTWRMHHGRDGVAKSYADIREGQFRSSTRAYERLARAVWNAGGEVDEIGEPERRPRSIHSTCGESGRRGTLLG